MARLKDGDLGDIDVQMREWAKAVRGSAFAIANQEVGFKSDTIESIMSLYGGSVPKGSGGKPPCFWHDDVERIEKAVLELTEERRQAIMVNYLYPGNQNDKLGHFRRLSGRRVSKTVFKYIVDVSLGMIHGRVRGFEAA